MRPATDRRVQHYKENQRILRVLVTGSQIGDDLDLLDLFWNLIF